MAITPPAAATAPMTATPPAPDDAVFEPAPADAKTAETDVWSEQSIEDFEAAFAQFEEQPAEQQPEAHKETGSFPAAEVLEEFEAQTMEIPAASVTRPAAPPRTAPAPAHADEQMMTETSSIDRTALLGALGTAAVTALPQTPAPQPAPPTAPQQENSDVITGDDVMDTIDNIFNLK
jgi:hypothetical protein